MYAQRHERIISGCIVFYLICLSFFSMFILDGLMDSGDVSASIIIVDENGNGNYSTIQEAIDNATFGDTIRVWSGVYIENLVISTRIKLIGNGSLSTIIDGSGTDWVSTIEITTSEVNISGFSIIGSTLTGIYVGFCSNVRIFNNSISNNDNNGIEIIESENVVIENNNITQNNYTGITVCNSRLCYISNNTISKTEEGVSLDFSSSITISNNTFIGCGVVIETSSWSDYFSHWTSHNIDGKNTINGKTLIYWKNKTSGTVPAGAGEVIIANCKNIMIDNQNCSNTSVGVLIGISDKVTVKNCICSFNTNGIIIQMSNNMTLSNNNISYNLNNGLYLYQSSSNIFSNNMCDHNAFYGINLDWSCNNNIISNNTCNYNHDVGLFMSLCNDNSLTNNEFNENWFSGLFLGWQCQFNNINYSKMCGNNVTGLYMGAASNNTFIGNNFSKNEDGIQLGWDCLGNMFLENVIAENSQRGVYLDPNCDFNRFFHNNFISNQNQASAPTGTDNSWSKSSEGNYWSDYTGLDDGSDGRSKGDLIGDTEIPHPSAGFDDYPFIIPNGWQYPGLAIIYDPGDIDFDGNYTLTWMYRSRAVGYILEEDDNQAFDSPIMIYNGSSITCDLINKPEGTYYYRLKVYNTWQQSAWSETVNITVDHSPDAPANFTVTVKPQGNTLNISWDLYLADIMCYELFYKTSGMTVFEMLANVSHLNHTFTHSELIDGQEYYYKIRAKDKYWQGSTFSEIISAVPKDSLAPNAPTGLSAEALSDAQIRLTWNPNIDNDLNGYLVYMHDPIKDLPGDFELKYTLPKTNTTQVISGLSEQITYQFKLKAFDEVPNNSTFSVVVNATPPDLTTPSAPKGLKVSNHTYSSLTITWEANTDKDVIGYILFRSKSNTNGFENITDITNITRYIDTGLDEETMYYYKLKAIDDANLESSFSEVINGATLLGPKPPSIESPLEDFELEEDTIDDSTISLFDVFKDINGDDLVFRCEGQTHINVTIDQTTGFVVLKPKQNWNGVENLKFYSNDSVYEVFDTVVITVTSVNDAPTQAKIIKPVDGLQIQANEVLSFEGWCYDADLPYGEVLTFKWSSDISGSIGTGKNLSNIILQPGEHVITLEVSDKEGKATTAEININVLKKSVTDDGDTEGKELYIYFSAGIIIIIVILCILAVLLRKRRSPQVELEDEDSELEE